MGTIVDSGFPPGWDEQRVRRLLDHYEKQTEEQVLAEDEAASDVRMKPVERPRFNVDDGARS